MRTQRVSILEGNNFVVSDLQGDIDASPTDTAGLFNWDTRYLSEWRLRVDGKSLTPLSVDELRYIFEPVLPGARHRYDLHERHDDRVAEALRRAV